MRERPTPAPGDAETLEASIQRLREKLFGTPGGCKVWSVGEGCICPRCDFDRLLAESRRRRGGWRDVEAIAWQKRAAGGTEGVRNSGLG
jgi:hypothetical protein